MMVSWWWKVLTWVVTIAMKGTTHLNKSCWHQQYPFYWIDAGHVPSSEHWTLIWSIMLAGVSVGLSSIAAWIPEHENPDYSTLNNPDCGVLLYLAASLMNPTGMLATVNHPAALESAVVFLPECLMFFFFQNVWSQSFLFKNVWCSASSKVSQPAALPTFQAESIYRSGRSCKICGRSRGLYIWRENRKTLCQLDGRNLLVPANPTSIMLSLAPPCNPSPMYNFRDSSRCGSLFRTITLSRRWSGIAVPDMIVSSSQTAKN